MNDWSENLKIDRPESSPAALARVRGALRAELATPQPSWRRGVLQWIGAWAALLAVIALASQLARISSPAVLAQHAPVLGTLLATGVLCVLSARAPRRVALRWASLGLALGSAVMLVLSRYPSVQGSSLPGWVCTVNHVVSALIPIALAARLMRQSAPSLLRSVVFGVGIGTTGAIVGELACEQGFLHVMIFHLGAWGLVAVAVVVLSQRVRPRSYAP